MDNQNKEVAIEQELDWVVQQTIALDAADILEKLAEENEFTRLRNKPTIEASLTLLREMLLDHYGLTKSPLFRSDIDDFVEFVVNEANQ